MTITTNTTIEINTIDIFTNATAIQKKRNDFLKLGSLLAESREAYKRMYQSSQDMLGGWDGMAKKLAGVGRSQADRIIAAHTAYDNILNGLINKDCGMLPFEDDGFEMPYSEYQLRPIVYLNNNEQMQFDIWERALEIAKSQGKKQPTQYMVVWAAEGLLDELDAELEKLMEEIASSGECTDCGDCCVGLSYEGGYKGDSILDMDDISR
jgi:hypothetical protein